MFLPGTDHVGERAVDLAEPVERDDILATIPFPDLGPDFALSLEPLYSAISLGQSQCVSEALHERSGRLSSLHEWLSSKPARSPGIFLRRYPL